jgi:acetyltransferase-like isoleucine patch superfamily enzyme
MTFKELVPASLTGYVRLLAAKLRYGDCFIGTPLVGKSVTLGRGCSLSRGVELSDDVRIGDFCYVNCGAIIASGQIGRYCSIGPYAMIGMPRHPTDYLSTSPMLYGKRNVFGTVSAWMDISAPPVIGNDVWIGAHAFVKQGIRIGDGSIIGAGAIVTHDVPPYAIVAGVPAKVIRYRFDADVIASLLASRWWERSVSELAGLREAFSTPVRTGASVAK